MIDEATGGAEKETLMRGSRVGKLTPEALYVHYEAVSLLDERLQLLVSQARAMAGVGLDGNLVKLSRRGNRVSFLLYPHFDSDPHPSLERATVVDLEKGTCRIQEYGVRDNPPVLHRKECFVGPSFPGRAKFAELTRAEEAAGLLTHTQRIGTRLGWQARLEAQGYWLFGHELRREIPGYEWIAGTGLAPADGYRDKLPYPGRAGKGFQREAIPKAREGRTL